MTNRKIPRGGIDRRQVARSICLQALYQWHMTGHSACEVESQFLADQDFMQADRRLFSKILHGVIATAGSLDALLVPHLDRAIKDLDPIELNILRMGAFELTDVGNTPYRVVINECIELGKQFGATDGHKYINGIMDQLARQVRTVETGTSNKARKV